MQRTISIPGFHTVSESNSREHWAKSCARHKMQKHSIRTYMLSENISKELPVTVTLTRQGRELDSDNLQSALKYVRDAISEHFIPGLAPGRADSDPRITWHYAQEKSSIKGITIDMQW